MISKDKKSVSKEIISQYSRSIFYRYLPYTPKNHGSPTILETLKSMNEPKVANSRGLNEKLDTTRLGYSLYKL